MRDRQYSDPEWMQKFLQEAAKYFENRPTDGEDSAYWANVCNAEKCLKIVDEIEKLRAEVKMLKTAESQRHLSKALDGYKNDDGFGGYPMRYNYYEKNKIGRAHV